MSFNANDSINLQNYEEFLVLYMDDELTPAQREEVEAFLLQHPHLQEELDLLLSTRLAPVVASFGNKESLLASAMKRNTADEDLLLYLDDELNATARKEIERRLAADADYAAEYDLLCQTKLDAAEAIPHPNKTELYRRAERRIVAAPWLRIAAAVLLLLFGSLVLLLNRKEGAADNNNVVSSTEKPAAQKPTPEQKLLQPPATIMESVATVTQKKETPKVAASNEGRQQNQNKASMPAAKAAAPSADLAKNKPEERPESSRPAIKFNVARFAAGEQPTTEIAVNKTIARSDVTSGLAERTPVDEGTPETAGSEADFKDTRRTPAKGFFRKVSRFIERRTGIGTANNDNELLIGAVALKLK